MGSVNPVEGYLALSNDKPIHNMWWISEYGKKSEVSWFKYPGGLR
jgi:hypothetical protein